MTDYSKITALYSRLSVGDEDRDGGESNSIQNQKIFLENYARGQHLTNIRHYIDDDESGRFFDRSAYSRMMDDVENGKIGVCIMKDLTRWGRDYLQVGNAMEIFRRNNVRFIAVNNGIDSEKPDTLEFAPFINIMSEWYAKDISKKVKTGIKTKGMSGKPIVTEAPYGYVKDPDNKDFWIIDEEAAEVVRLIFRLFIGGKNRNQIAVHLKNEQIPTPTFYMKDRGRGTCKNKTLNEDNRCKWNKATLTNMALHLSSLFQDTAIYPLMQAQQHDLTAATWYVAEGQLDAVLHALKGLGYSVTATNERLLSTKLPLYFLFIPAFMLCVSIVFYTLSAGKKNVLKKMEGYTTGNILLGEIKAFAPALCLCFLLIFAAAMICAVWLHPVATWQFGLFLLGDCLWLLVPLILGILLSLLFLSGQRSAEYVKGKVPKRGIYITNTLAKAAFLIFILFSLTIAMRNITQIYNTFHAAEFCSQKTKGYVTVPLNNVNSGRAPEGADYLAFYYATVDRYNGILMAANDFNYDLFEGKMLGEAYGQDYAHINRNYLAFNPIYAPDGEQIGDALLSDTHVNILLPKSKEYRRDEVRERGASWGNSGDVNIVLYDDKASDIYSYNASTGLGGNGALPAPILVVKEGDLLDGLFIEAWCSQGAYFLYVPTDDPYAELLPILRETGIDAATVSTPTVAATFDKMLHHLTYMLMIWGVQALVLLIGLFCLILFGARLYCDNYRDRIACRLIEGHSLLSCIRTHLVLTVLYYGAVAAGLLLLKLAIELDYNILLGTLLAELLITLLACGSIARKNLYQIVKGAEA